MEFQGMSISRRMMVAAMGLALLSPLASVRAQEAPLQVVATTGMIADAARQVGGAGVEVVGLMGPGVDPHAYRPTRSDIATLTRADLVLWHGLYLEAQMEDFLLGLAARRPVVAVAETLPADQLIAHTAYADRVDPHVWMNPPMWAEVVRAVRDALIAERPEHAAAFTANADAHLAGIAALDTYGQTVLASVPAGRRILVTAHDAFAYFGRAYGFEVVGIQGISTESEAGLARIAEVIDLLVARDIGAVFVETSVSDRNIRALIEGAAARGHDVRIGGELFSDAMGPEGTYEGTYIGMIDHNITVISRALGGDAPERGMDDRLSAGI
jgi:manganese/zinc/iron transport system substrate-binding protein